jgi:type II secretory pathway pseudopilin PulG
MATKSRLLAFSLLELISVLSILGLVAAIVIPWVVGGDEKSKIAACEAHKGNIEVQVELWMQDTGSWPAGNLSDVGADRHYFPAGLPVCPLDGSSYTIDGSGRVSGHTH